MRPDRRALLLTGAATLAVQSQAATPGQLPTGLPLSDLARLKPYRSQRSSSYDRTGGNDDWVKVEPGATVPLLETTGIKQSPIRRSRPSHQWTFVSLKSCRSGSPSKATGRTQ